MKKNGSDKAPKREKLDTSSAHFSVDPDEATQDAVIRNLHIPRLLRGKITKPDTTRGR